MGKTEVKKVRYKCEICEKDYAKSIDLKFHVKCVHDGDTSRECACEICGRRPDELRSHINKIHGNTKIFKCKNCDKELKFEIQHYIKEV